MTAKDRYRKNYKEKHIVENIWRKTKDQYKIVVPKGYQFHHWSYREEHALDMIMLPIKLHRLVHKKTHYDRKYMCYRVNITGELLITKEKHMQFIQSIINTHKVAA